MHGITDVIAAVSTPPGKGGVAIIRISGEGTFEVVKKAFRCASGDFDSIKPRYAKYGYIYDGDEIIDDVILTIFPAPHSYTGEDTAEISCHGGVLVTRAILELLLTLGTRIADAGEFTRRAFLNGKLSLTEAEAVGSLLEAESRAQISLSSVQARTRLGKRLSSIRESLVATLSSVFARIDYPDEDLGDFDDGELLSRLYNIKESVDSLLSTYKTGKAISEGVRCAIVGKPNVGKSTVYNLLVGEDAAIVTDIPGTTRDVLTSSVSLGRVMLRLADTAGIRTGNLDAVETIGIEKSEKMLSECELLFAIFDISRPFDSEDEALIDKIKKANCVKIAILNKNDAPCRFDATELDGIFTSVLVGSARHSDRLIEEITESVEKAFLDGEIKLGESAVVSTARQNASLRRASELLDLAIDSLEAGFAQDAVAGDLERALSAVSELDGRAVSEEVVADIFAKFCVGK